jgi:hypothetical protein
VTAAPDVFVCVRPSIDWTDEAAVDAQLIPEFRPKRATWDALFTVPYHAFRARLTEIARENLARIRGATVAPAAAAPEGALVVPVDDDDWFAPDLAERLAAAYDPQRRGYHWRQRVLQARLPGNALSRLLRGRRDPLRDDHERFVCGSNNYAVVYEGAWKGLLASHAQASRYFTAHPDRVRAIDTTASIQNRNLSSQTVMGWRKPAISRGRLLRRWRRHRRFYREVELPPDLLWARPHVDAMARLMDALQPRRASHTDGGK